MYISSHFEYKELVHTNHTQFKQANFEQGKLYFGNMRLLCNYILEPIRQMYGLPMIITSCFRIPELNEYIGSTKTSQHLKAEAADFKVKNVCVKKLFNSICSSYLKWGQLIYEIKNGKEWIHCSLPTLERNGQVLIFENGKYRRIK